MSNPCDDCQDADLLSIHFHERCGSCIHNPENKPADGGLSVEYREDGAFVLRGDLPSMIKHCSWIANQLEAQSRH